ncbi:Oxygen sensor histidine kinase NreB [Planctomycetes bacterium CA13]|uniref:histidine kinase n=1 Tax=Novipirellula herctigrandis TaxID=2527986 RepID=A0A5C5YXU7_9BACT|nr:Oxygen sensor histidine kinase NreB [Planctomycetes bacterium CA13]
MNTRRSEIDQERVPCESYGGFLGDQTESSLQAARAEIAGMDVDTVKSLIQELRARQCELEMRSGDPSSAQSDLTESQNRFSDLYEFAPVGYFTLDRQGSIVECNLTASRLFGSARSALIGTQFSKFVAPESQDHWCAHFHSVFSRESRQACEIELHAQSNPPSIVKIQSVLRAYQKSDVCFVAMMDVTDLRMAQRNLCDLNEQLEQRVVERTKEIQREREFVSNLIETAQSIVLVLNCDGKIVSFNRYFESMTGWGLDELKGCDWFETCLPEFERKSIENRFAKSIIGDRVRGHINFILCKDGSRREVEWYDAMLSDSSGNPIGLLCSGQDITERRELERAVMRIASEEQRRMGIDLHDGVGQELTGLALMADSLAMSLRKKDLPESEIAGRIATQIDYSLEQIRQLARGLYPVKAEGSGLNSAFVELAAHVSELYGIQCYYTGDKSSHRLDPEKASHLYRISQEAITNAVKHGNATEIQIETEQMDDTLVLRVADNGLGIDDENNRKAGGGMRSMGYRASIIGGKLSISAGVKQGTKQGTLVTCIVPNPISQR